MRSRTSNAVFRDFATAMLMSDDADQVPVIAYQARRPQVNLIVRKSLPPLQ